MQSKAAFLKDDQTRYPLSGGLVFCVLWLLLFVLYFPTAKAGFVTDFTGWLDQVKNHRFWEYINRSNFQGHSLYQFTQFVTYIFYKLFGINPWLWHLLFITLHATNGLLLFIFCSHLLDDTNISNGRSIAFAGVVLFSASPYMSEVIVWEPAFHYLMGLLLLLLILIWVQRYIHTGYSKYAVWACIVYFLSTFSLEFFYTTPWLVLLLCIFYKYGTSFNKKSFKKVVICFFLPMLFLFCIRLLVSQLVYGSWVTRFDTHTVTTVQKTWGKPTKYLFHLLFLGRFFSDSAKLAVYEFCDSMAGIITAYSIVVFFCLYIFARFRNMSGKGKVASLLFIYLLGALALMIPLWFNSYLLVLFDRYKYFSGAFFYLLVAVVISLITVKYLRVGILAIFGLVNLFFATKVIGNWNIAEKTDQVLLTSIPDPGNKTLVLLNLPESLDGIPMIGSDQPSEFKLMHNLLFPDKQITTPVYDVLSTNIRTIADGAHVLVANDSTIYVILNQWGTWWWLGGFGGRSYENKDFKLDLVNPGSWYTLTLKKPAPQYLFLYETEGRWKTVDMGKRNEYQY